MIKSCELCGVAVEESKLRRIPNDRMQEFDKSFPVSLADAFPSFSPKSYYAGDYDVCPTCYQHICGRVGDRGELRLDDLQNVTQRLRQAQEQTREQMRREGFSADEARDLSGSPPAPSTSESRPSQGTAASRVPSITATSSSPISSPAPSKTRTGDDTLGTHVGASLAFLLLGGLCGGLVGATQFAIEHFLGWTTGMRFLMSVSGATLLGAMIGAMVGSLLVNAADLNVQAHDAGNHPFFGGFLGGMLGALLGGLAGLFGWTHAILDPAHGFHLPSLLAHLGVRWPRFWERVGASAASVLVVLAVILLLAIIARLAWGGIDSRTWRVLRTLVVFAPLAWGGYRLLCVLPFPAGGFDLTTPEWTLEHARGDIVSLEFSKDGTMLLVSGADGVALWDVPRRKVIGRPIVGGLFPRAAFCGGGAQVVTVNERYLTVWNVADVMNAFDTVVVRKKLDGGHLLSHFFRRAEINAVLGTRGLSVSGDGQRAIVCVERGALLCDLREVIIAGGFATPLGGDGEVTSALIHPEGGWMFTGHAKGRVMQNVIYGSSPKISLREGSLPVGNWFLPSKVSALAISRDGKRLAAAIEGSKVQVCNAEQNLGGAEQWLGKPLEHPYPVTQMAFSPDGTLLLTSCCEDKGLHPRAEVRLWDVARGTQIGESIAQESAGALSFSPDAKTFVTADLSGLVKVWRTPDTRIGK